MGDKACWQALDALVASTELRIDRPRGSRHPRYGDVVYPLDYGYLAGVRAPATASTSGSARCRTAA